jgi:hypothetical protein
MQLAGAVADFLSFGNSARRTTLALCDIEGDEEIDGDGHAHWSIP